ncbi:MAG: hypothetical protein DLM56_05825 [Pseudonocardiales bacterium]|nr:MAG: hypothetical protein DLM56_05825 [Pseudonocardiales bacterium]
MLALLGSGTGVGVFAVVNKAVASHGIAGITWYQADAAPGWGRYMVGVVVLQILVFALSRLYGRRSLADELGIRRQVPPRPSRIWPALLLASGIGLLTYGCLHGRSPGSPSSTIFLLGTGLTAVGMIAAYPLLVRGIAVLAAPRAERLALQLGMRRLQAEPTSVQRVSAGLVMLIFCGMLAIAVSRDAVAAQGSPSSVAAFDVQGDQLSPQQRHEVLSLPAATAATITLNSVVSQGAPTTVLFASCHAVAELLGHPAPGCSDGVGYRLVATNDPGGNPLHSGEKIALPLSFRTPPPTLTVTTPSRTLALPPDDVYGSLSDAQLLMPTSALPVGDVPVAANLTLTCPTDPVAITALGDQFAAVAPTAELYGVNGNVDQLNTDRAFRSLAEFVLGIGLVLVIAAVVIATVDRAFERRANLVSLRIVGVDSTVLRRAQAAQVALATALGGLLAVAVGKLAAQAYLKLGGAVPRWTWSDVVAGIILVVICTALSAIASGLGISRAIDPSLVRRQ